MIKNVDFQKTTEDAFLKYAASVAQERAIPDVRDMLKIGLRQGLYAQYTNKLTHKDKFQNPKSAEICRSGNDTKLRTWRCSNV